MTDGAEFRGRLPFGDDHDLFRVADKSVFDPAEDAVLDFSPVAAVPLLDLFVLHEDGLVLQDFGRRLVCGVVEDVPFALVGAAYPRTIAVIVVRPLFLPGKLALLLLEAVAFFNHHVVFRTVAARNGRPDAHVQSDDRVGLRCEMLPFAALVIFLLVHVTGDVQVPSVRLADEVRLGLFPSFELADATYSDPSGDVLDVRLLSSDAVGDFRLGKPQCGDLSGEADFADFEFFILEGFLGS